MQSRRNEAAASKFFRKLLKPQDTAPRVVITDKLRSYGAAMKKLLTEVEHRQHKGLNNRAENTHRPTRIRERRMGGIVNLIKFMFLIEKMLGNLKAESFIFR